MKFKKSLVYLGIRSSEFTRDDGKPQTYYVVSFFDPEAVSPLQVNVMENKERAQMIDLLLESNLGDHVNVTFQLRSQDKLYKLQIADVTL